MISIIKGELIDLKHIDNGLSECIFMISGIGYEVLMPTRNAEKLAKHKEYLVNTYFYVREDSQQLFGFLEKGDKEMFEELIGVNGVGPKIGLAIISHFKTDAIKKYIIDGDFKSLSKVTGLGPKGSKKIILDLSGKLELDDEQSSGDSRINEVEEALNSLGFSSKERKAMLETAEDLLSVNENLTIEQLIQKVLSNNKE